MHSDRPEIALKIMRKHVLIIITHLTANPIITVYFVEYVEDQNVLCIKFLNSYILFPVDNQYQNIH